MTAAFILASSSPRRRELLSSLGIIFSIQKPEINEDQHPGEAPLDYVKRLSQEKAAAIVAQAGSAATILAADTVVIDEGHILGKPADADEARWMLRQLRGKGHRVCTSITLVTPGASPQTEVTCTEVYMRHYGEAEIEAYIASGDPFDKAGGYAIQNADFAPVARIDGSYSNVVGLPLETLREMLAAHGWSFEEEPHE
ncbi:MAG: Maf family protein [Anaerolineae bacterium]|nr:Maf family protein [Anaerolineae bacterium]